MPIFRSLEDANAAAVMDTIDAATSGGFTNQQVMDDGHIYCAIPDTNALVDIFPDGSWEYQNVKEDGTMEEMSGPTAAFLRMFCDPRLKPMFFEIQEKGELDAGGED